MAGTKQKEMLHIQFQLVTLEEYHFMKYAISIFLFSIILVACSSREPSRERLETIAEITLPDEYTVIKDDYEESGKDYYIQYYLQFNHDSTMQLVKAIQSSKYYDNGHAPLLYDSVWYKDGSLFKFEARSHEGNTTYEIEFNPVSGILQYIEQSDRMKT